MLSRESKSAVLIQSVLSSVVACNGPHGSLCVGSVIVANALHGIDLIAAIAVSKHNSWLRNISSSDPSAPDAAQMDGWMPATSIDVCRNSQDSTLVNELSTTC